MLTGYNKLPAILPLRRQLAICIAAFTFLICLAVVPAEAQSGQGSINGRVTDPRGALVAGAAVVVVNADTAVEDKTATNKAGEYNVTSLNPGSYTVTVTANGFERAVISNVIVSAAQSAETNVALAVGSENTTVTVTSQDSLLIKDSDVSTTVDHQLVENLPYPERSALEAVLLIPGVDGDPTMVGGIATENPDYLTGQVTPGASLRVGGAPPGTHAFLVDGSDVTQSSFARSGVNLSGRDVQETTAITSGMSAKYGRTGAGLIIQTTRTGTDQFHGAITWRHTDPFFNAYPLGGTQPNDIHRNYYGFYLGGPVFIPKLYPRNDKTFFYVGVEPARLRNTLGVRGIFYSPAELAGHFNSSLSLPAGLNLYYQSPVNANGFPNGAQYTSSALYQKITGPLADCGAAYIAANPSATVCPNDLAPQLAQNPFAQFVLSYFPTPSNPGPYVQFDNPNATVSGDGNNANYERGVINVDNRYNIRIDHQFGFRNQMFVRYTVIPVKATRFFALGADNPLSQSPEDDAYTHDLAVGYTHIFSNNLVGVFHYSYMRVKQQRLPATASLASDFAGKYGLTPATAGIGFPDLGSFTGALSFTMKPGSLTPSIAIDQNFLTGADFSLTKGAHLFEFGVDVRWIQSNQYDQSGSYGGIYSFSGAQTNSGSSGGSPLATFILGTVSSFTNTPIQVPGYYRWHYFAGYFEDNWRATAKLTLNLGLRYNVETPRIEKFNNQGSVVNAPGTLNGVAANAAFCFSGTCGLHNTLWPTNYLSFEPRVGLAYAVTPLVVLRAAYTLSHLPLSGYGNTPNPDMNAGSKVTFNSGGTAPGIVNYISNPVSTPKSGYATFNALRGQPNYSSNSLSPVYVNQTNAIPYIQSYTASIQYQPRPKTVIQVTYQGAKGTHLVGPFTGSFNAPSISKVVAAVQSNQNLGASMPNSYGITDTNGVIIPESGSQALEPYQNFFNQSLLEIYPRHGALHYNAFYVSVNQRFNKHITFLVHYQWEKSLDNVPDTTNGSEGGPTGTTTQDAGNTSSEWAVSSYDQASRFRAGFHARLPIGKGEWISTHHSLLDNLIGNITTSGIITSSSGFPNFVTLGSSGYFYSVTPVGTNGCTGTPGKFCTANALPTGYTLRPNIVPGVPLINPNWKKNPFGSSGTTDYLNAAAFAIPGTQGSPAFGNAPRTLSGARSPREFLFDARITKGFTIRKRYKLNLDMTSNNVLNHPVYFQISNRSLDSAGSASTSTGLITGTPTGNFGNLNQGASAGLSRVVYVGAEFVF